MMVCEPIIMKNCSFFAAAPGATSRDYPRLVGLRYPHAVQSARAIHQAARLSIERHFFSDWCGRAPYAELHPRFRGKVRGLTAWPAPEQYDDLARRVPQAP